jgi:hypothetical protein
MLRNGIDRMQLYQGIRHWQHILWVNLIIPDLSKAESAVQELQRILSRSLDFLYSGTSSPSGLQVDCDYLLVIKTIETQIIAWQHEWQNFRGLGDGTYWNTFWPKHLFIVDWQAWTPSPHIQRLWENFISTILCLSSIPLVFKTPWNDLLSISDIFLHDVIRPLLHVLHLLETNWRREDSWSTLLTHILSWFHMLFSVY